MVARLSHLLDPARIDLDVRSARRTTDLNQVAGQLETHPRIPDWHPVCRNLIHLSWPENCLLLCETHLVEFTAKSAESADITMCPPSSEPSFSSGNPPSPIRSFLNRPLQDWICFGSAFVFVFISRLQIALRPIKRLAPSWGSAQTETLRQPLSAPDNKIVTRVSWAVQAVSRHSPIALVCLPQAIAAQRMLARRGIPSTLYLGVRKPNDRDLAAHAWLRAGHRVVTGDQARPGHMTVGCFAKLPNA